MKKNNVPSKIPTRPNTVAETGTTPPEKKLNVTYSSRKYSTNSLALGTNENEFKGYLSPEYNSPKDIESLCTLIDCGDSDNEAAATTNTSPPPPPAQPPSGSKKSSETPPKLPLFKQSALDSISVRPTSRKSTDRKYVPNYTNQMPPRGSTTKPATRKYGSYTATKESKNQSHKKTEKRLIPLTDELKSKTELRLQKTDSLMQLITEEIQRQLKTLDENDEATTYLVQLLNDSPKLDNIESRIGKLEGKFDALVKLLHELRVIKDPQLKIKLEEYDLEKLNSKLSMHLSMRSELSGQTYDNAESSIGAEGRSCSEVSVSEEKNSDVNIHQQSYYSTQQKLVNLQTASQDTLKLNGVIPKEEKERLNTNIFYPTQFELKKSIKPISRIV